MSARHKLLGIGLSAGLTLVATAGAASADGWFRSLKGDALVSHSSHQLIEQGRDGRYLKGTIQRSARIVTRGAPKVIIRAAPYAAGAAVTATAPAWFGAAIAGAAIVGTGYTAYDLYREYGDEGSEFFVTYGETGKQLAASAWDWWTVE